jgi:UDPglucose 6-dehydrogenase
VKTAQDAGAPLSIIEAVVAANERRKGRMADAVVAICGGSVRGKRIAVLGLTFKPNTDDMRDSPSLAILPALQAAGATLAAFDPEGMAEARKLMPGIAYCATAEEAMTGADALLLLTEWNEFRALDPQRIKSLLRTPVVIDLRNVYNPADMRAAGLHYSSVGRP